MGMRLWSWIMGSGLILIDLVGQASVKTDNASDLQPGMAKALVGDAAQKGSAEMSSATTTDGAVDTSGVSTQAQEGAVEHETQGIDTVDLDQPEGNWLKKRLWWEKAKDKYKEIRILYEEIFNDRMTFLEKRSELEKNVFNPFYRDMGIEQGELRELVANTLEYIDKEREESGFLDENEQAFLERLTHAKKDLEQLKLDIDAIASIDMAIDKAITILTNKINEAHRFEQSAWSEFDTIAQELSDTKAMERYYSIEGIYKNLKVLQQYIKGQFSEYFNTLVESAGAKTEKVKKEVKELKDRDIDLKDKIRAMFVEEEQSEDQEAALIAEKARIEQEKAKKLADQVAKSNFFCRAWCSFVNFLKLLWNLLFGWWFYKI
jgi:hypothetical protein